MRHGNKLNHLGRKSAHRKAMLSNMACSLIEHKRISTTIAKAKALRVYVEPLLTKSKTDSTHSRRIVFSYLQSKEVVSELFRDVAPKIATRNGGYTRIIRLGYRLGDNAEMCMIELVDFNEIYTNETAKKTTRRSRRGGSTTSGAATTETVADAEVVNEEAPTIEAEVVAEEVVAEEVVAEEVAAEEVVAEEVVAEEVVAEEAVAEEVVAEEAVAEEVVAEEVVAEEVVAEEVVAEEVVAEDETPSATDDAPSDDAEEATDPNKEA
jgi:large subunit ribosomal protein L17